MQSTERLARITEGQRSPCCPEMYGTHICAYLYRHEGKCKCACDTTIIWNSGAQAPVQREVKVKTTTKLSAAELYREAKKQGLL